MPRKTARQLGDNGMQNQRTKAGHQVWLVVPQTLSRPSTMKITIIPSNVAR